MLWRWTAPPSPHRHPGLQPGPGFLRRRNAGGCRIKSGATKIGGVSPEPIVSGNVPGGFPRLDPSDTLNALVIRCGYRGTLETRSGKLAWSPPSPTEVDAPAEILRGLIYVALLSPPHPDWRDAQQVIKVTRAHSIVRCYRNNHERGVSAIVDTNAGRGIGYMFQGFSCIKIDAEPAPRPPIPTNMITRRVTAFLSALEPLLAPLPLDQEVDATLALGKKLGLFTD